MGGVTDFGINHGGICKLDGAGEELAIRHRETVTHIRSILPRQSPPRLPQTRNGVKKLRLRAREPST